MSAHQFEILQEPKFMIFFSLYQYLIISCLTLTLFLLV